MKNEENQNIRDAEIQRQHVCDPSQNAEREKWEQACAQENQSSMTDPGSDYGRGSDDSEKSWFICQTDMDIELHSNISSSGTAGETSKISCLCF